MSEVKVNKISPRSGTTVTLGDSGDTFTLPSGATINNQGTATNFGATGSASWTTTVKTNSDSGFTAVAGEGYFLNTTSGTISVNLPAGTPGAVVAFKDYLGTFDTNAVTLVQNGSDKIGGSTINATLETEGIAVTLVFIDSTQGWLVTDDGLQSQASTAQYVTATGGTIVTTGNFKTHIFTGPGAFCVSCAGNACGSNTLDYLVVAGGGGGGAYNGGGGGAGGFRVSNSAGCVPAPTMSPLIAPAGLTATPGSFPIVVGGGGAAGQAPTPSMGVTGSVSTFSTISSAGGGGGGSASNGGLNGGSGGGMGGESPGGVSGGTGNTPPTNPAQGTDGGLGGITPSGRASGGGGGVGAAGADAQSGDPACAGPGGIGSFIADAFIGSPSAPSYGTPGPTSLTRYFSGGGGGGTESSPSIPGGLGSNGSGGSGGGGGGGPGPGARGVGTSGTVNTGGAGGGASRRDDAGPPYSNGGAGGSGIVMIRYKFQ